MQGGTAAPGHPAVLVPAGTGLLDAAAWVGHACWSELALHKVLTAWLATEADPELCAILWNVRSHRSMVAEAWHRRLPELRELPRAGFVEPEKRDEEGLVPLDVLSTSGPSHARSTALRIALASMATRYDARVPVAVGPADGPTAATLADALRTTAADVTALAAWTQPRSRRALYR